MPEYRLDTLANGAPNVTRTFPRLANGRLPVYHRLDLRTSRRWRLGRGELTTFVEAFNAYNRRNVRGFDYEVRVEGDTVIVRPLPRTLLPALPTIGVTWRF